MKKYLVLFLCITLIFVSYGCGNIDSSGKAKNQTAGVSDVLEAGMAEADRKRLDNGKQSANESDVFKESVDNNASESDQIKEAEKAVNTEEGIDIDLTVLSKTMVYSELFRIMCSPESYVGKIVKMEGIFASYKDENTGKRYFACIISDAAACCSQAIEFVLSDDYKYPEDYPEQGEEICIVGEFNIYKEGNFDYCNLNNAKLA